MPRSVELFAGGGGMALGMFNAGFEHEQLIELDPRACKVLESNAERSPNLWKKENVRNMDVHDWLKEAPRLGLVDIDLVAGGPPCQPFSISGAHAGESDGRNGFPAAVETVRALRPKCFVFENVLGLLRPSFKPYYDYIFDQLSKPSVKPKTGGGEHWTEHHARILRTKRAGLTYRVHRQVIEAANVGVPQTRKRVFLIGIREEVPGWDRWTDVPLTHDRDALLRDQWVIGSYWKRHGIKRPETPELYRARVEALRSADELVERKPWRTTRDAIAALPKPSDGKDAPDVLNHRGIPGARTYPGHQGGWIDWPAKTLKAGVHGVAGGEGMIRLRNGSVRYLTVRESARIQTFPDNYEIPGTRTAAMRALGNAVAVDVAEIIGKKLRVLLHL